MSLLFRRGVNKLFVRGNVGRQCSLMSTYFTPQHEYLFKSGNEATIGISDFAQNQLGDVVYVDLPAVGDSIEKGETFGSVESVKAASDVYMPASGEVIAVNEELAESPNLVNESPMDDGWFIKIKMSNESDVEGLLQGKAYEDYCESEEH